jgi:hypothetical protein
VSALDDLFSQTEDMPIPGGCDRCDAYQTMTVAAPGIYSLTINHDDWCPFLRSMSATAN